MKTSNKHVALIPQVESVKGVENVEEIAAVEGVCGLLFGPGDFMERVYQDPTGVSPYVDVFLAYFQSQRAGETPHSPQHCLPGAGWNPEENTRITLSLPGHAPFPANRYVISKADDRRLVLRKLLETRGPRSHAAHLCVRVDEPLRRDAAAMDACVANLLEIAVDQQ